MSVPRSLDLPPHARRVTLDTSFGTVAALRIDAVGGPQRATVLLIPGFTGSKEDFIAVLEPLSRAGYAVVAIDQRGQFETPDHDDAGGTDPYSLDRFARDAVAIAAAVGGPLHVVGHSFGGLVATAMVLRDAAQVRSLTLLCSGPAALPPAQAADLPTFVTALPLMGKDTVWRVMRERSTVASGAATPEVEEFLLRRFTESSTDSLVAIATALCDAPDAVDALAELGVPVLVAHGENDDAWPLEEQRRMAERLAAPLRVLPGAGHSPAVDSPDLLAETLIPFFADLDLRV